jgi:uncharacterized protein YhjY with autotransporter beta-barrel domain
MSIRHTLFASAAVALGMAAGAHAQSVAITRPNTITTPGAVSATLNGVTYVNQGMVGTVRLPADLHDFNGETLGSFSSLAMDLGSWRRAADGTYSGGLYTLPDRGPNNVGGLTTTDYAARLNRFNLTFSPYTGSAALASTAQQGTLTQAGGFLLKDSTGQVFTGRDPQAGVITRNGVLYPTPPAGDIGAGKISMDAEAVTFLRDGSFYVGDEYGAAIYYFDASGKQIGGIQATPDILPRVNGQVNFNGANDSPLVPGTTGRRSNQGMEGLSVSPDGTRLVAVLQSATLQDNPTNQAFRRNNTRIVVYDISQNRTPTTPLAEYVLQLPVYNNSATGVGNPTATAAQSEVLALNNSQFLVLSRDGNGRGANGNANAIAFKSVLLVDTKGATNLVGTPYAGTTPISTTVAPANGGGLLEPGITPVQQVELVNMLNTALSEKWEAMGLVPVLDEATPHDFFLLIGNDNDFVSHDVDAAGVTDANTALTSATAGVGDNDNVIMFYRLTLPTYIDPQALAALDLTAPVALASARVSGARLTAQGVLAASGNLAAARRARFAGVEIGGLRGWAQGSGLREATPADPGAGSGGALAVGVENGDETLRYGFTLSGATLDSDNSAVFNLQGESYGGGVYAGWFSEQGFWVQGAVGLASLRMDIDRPSAYGQTARGSSSGHAAIGSIEAGYGARIAGGRIGPFLSLLYNDVDMKGYAEQGASVSNGVIPKIQYKRTETTVGLEGAFGEAATVRPSMRAGYTFVSEGGDDRVKLMLAGLPDSSATVVLPGFKKGFVSAQFALGGGGADFTWRAALDARATKNDASGAVTVGIGKRF